MKGARRFDAARAGWWWPETVGWAAIVVNGTTLPDDGTDVVNGIAATRRERGRERETETEREEHNPVRGSAPR